jgi:hypothetical protein
MTRADGRFSVGRRLRVLDARHELVVLVSSAALTACETHIPGVGPAEELDSASALPYWPLAVRRAPLLSPGWLVAGWRRRRPRLATSREPSTPVCPATADTQRTTERGGAASRYES